MGPDSVIRWREKKNKKLSTSAVGWDGEEQHIMSEEFNTGSMREAAKPAYSYKAFKITPPFIVTPSAPTFVFRPDPYWQQFLFSSTKSNYHVFAITITCLFVLLCFFLLHESPTQDSDTTHMESSVPASEEC